MLWVIKVGGSLYKSEHLVEWLNTLSRCKSQQIVIVPGGGPFADQVRSADQQFNLDQALAHNMAVLAMQQFGNLLASLCPELGLVSNKEQLNACWEQTKVALWEPYEMVTQYCDLAKTWDLTSDSLAAWLAIYLSADHLMYVKSADITLTEANVDELASHGCIDSILPKLISTMNTSVHFMHHTQAGEFEQRLNAC